MIVLASRNCRTTASFGDDCQRCLESFPEELGTGGTITEPFPFLLLCQEDAKVDALTAALLCADGLDEAEGPAETGDERFASLRKEVAAAKDKLRQLVSPAVELLTRAVKTIAVALADDATAVSALTVSPRAFPGVCKLGRMVKARPTTESSTH